MSLFKIKDIGNNVVFKCLFDLKAKDLQSLSQLILPKLMTKLLLFDSNDTY